MPDPHPLMMMLLENNSFVGMSQTMEDEIMPLEDQLEFGPGDAALVATANTPLEEDFVIVRCLDPERHAETFPDWEERLLQSYVLCEFFSGADPEITIGWFSRLKLLRISNYRYRETRRWLKDGFPDEIPDWCAEVFGVYTAQLSQRAPTRVPRPVVCQNCGGAKVQLRIVRRIEYIAPAGQLIRDGRDVYVPIAEPEENDSHVARLVCTECTSAALLEDEEWLLPGITN